MTCAYCGEEITGSLYTYKWFPDQKKTLPVHNHHLTITKPRSKEMGRYTPPKIEDVGLEKYLDDTKTDHNGNGYAEFCDMIKHETPVQRRADKFNVDRTTIYRWLDVYHRELDDVDAENS